MLKSPLTSFLKQPVYFFNIMRFFCNSRCGPMHDWSQVVQEHEKRSHDWYSLRLLFSRIAVFCPKCRRIWSGSSHVFTISEFTNFFLQFFLCFGFLQGGSFLLLRSKILLKVIYSEKATKFYEIFTLLLNGTT